MKKLKNVTTPKIILGCTLAFAIGCFLFFWGGFYLLTETSLTQLPNSPEKPATIIGIERPDWYEANPIVQTASGNIYKYGNNQDTGSKEWAEIEEAERTLDTACEARDEANIATTAGNIIDCRAIQLAGEWCPPPINVYALTEQGTLWEFSEPQPCTWSYYVFSFVAGIAGLFLGSILAIIRFVWRKSTQVS
ncbi:hypothetical protein [Candidatus Leptofilum sp.]|uniref:hypothetical protein n=1 Tax=Candidatus Leptofilum sp. TaxID=3241576 RepID=UPI003B59BFEB